MADSIVKPAWEASQLRLTLFLSKALSADAALWSMVAGEAQLEQQTTHLAGSFARGNFRGNTLEVRATGSRLDILLAPAPPRLESDQVPEIKITMAPFQEALATLDELASRVIDNLPSQAQRVALGTQLLCFTETGLGSYELLKSQLTSINLVPDRTRDFRLEINWPVQSQAIPGTMLNRLTKWASLVFRTQINASEIVVAEKYAAALELDMSTDAAREVLISVPELHQVYLELRALALENAEKGEVQ